MKTTQRSGKKRSTEFQGTPIPHLPIPEGNDAAMEKLKKYLFKHIDVAKQARVFDPTQLGSLSHDITMYAHVIPADMCPRIEQSGEWKLYVDSVQPGTQQFNILGWWEGMRERLPLLYKCARRTLAIPHTHVMWKGHSRCGRGCALRSSTVCSMAHTKHMCHFVLME